MAGRPYQRAIAAELEKRALAQCEKDATTLDYICEWIEQGQTIADLIRSVDKSLIFAYPNQSCQASLYSYLRRTYGEDVQLRFEKARQRGSFAFVEKAIEIIDDASTETREDLNKAKMRADVRITVAERFNRDKLGAARSPNVVINVQALHLDALRARVLENTPSVSRLLPAHTRDSFDTTDTAIDTVSVSFDTVSDGSASHGDIVALS